jgi:hypothetical protein
MSFPPRLAILAGILGGLAFGFIVGTRASVPTITLPSVAIDRNLDPNAGVSGSVLANGEEFTDEEVVDKVRGLKPDLTDELPLFPPSDLIRVTDEPQLMNEPIAGACGFSISLSTFADVHGTRYCDIFVTAGALDIIRSGQGRYPVGSLIVKAKYPSKDRAPIELFTVMRKMKPGYAPETGDWEYSVVDGDAHRILARGKIASCIRCHNDYQATDFVTRTYME